MRNQIGAITEDTYGTYKAPTRFFEFLNETLNRDKRTIQSDNLRASSSRQMRRSARRVVTGRSGSGQINMDLGPDGCGLWFRHMLGAVATSQPDDVGAPLVFQHVFTLASLWDQSLTIQKGVERKDETVVPYSFVGCKLPSWELAVTTDDFLKLRVDVDAQDVLTGEPLEVATTPDGNLWHFQQGAIRLGGDLIAGVTRASATGQNPMRTEDYYLGNQGLKDQPRDEGYPSTGGQIEADFIDESVLVEAYHTDEPLSLELSFVGEEIEEEGFNEELTIEIADIRLDGETPKVSGMELPTLTIPYTGYDDGVAEGVQITLQNADATA